MHDADLNAFNDSHVANDRVAAQCLQRLLVACTVIGGKRNLKAAEKAKAAEAQ